jgi:hypothetical protein
MIPAAFWRLVAMPIQSAARGCAMSVRVISSPEGTMPERSRAVARGKNGRERDLDSWRMPGR